MRGFVTARFETGCDQLRAALAKPVFGLGLVLLFLFYVYMQSLGADPDLFARMAVGKLIEAQGVVPLTDPFAFSPKKEIWIDHEWLAGVVFYQVAKYFSDGGLFIAKILFSGLSIWLLWQAAAIQCSRKHFPFFLFLVASLEMAVIWKSTVRAQVFTYLFLPYLLWAMIQLRSRQRLLPLMFFPLVNIIWLNAHGGFVVGLGLFGIFTAVLIGQRHPQWLRVTAIYLVSILATLINPYGLRYLEFILEAVSMPRPNISEWAALEPLASEAVIFNLFVGLALYLGLKHYRQLWPEAIPMFIAAAYYGYSHTRLTPILLMVVLAYGTSVVVANFKPGRRLLVLGRSFYAAVALGACYWLVLLVATLTKPFTLDTKGYPGQALTFLQENYQGGDLLVDFNNGSYALWRLYPRFLISLDGRYEEVYPNSTVQLVSQALDPSSTNWRQSLAELNPDFIVVATNQSKLERFTDEGWLTVYSDQHFKLFSKQLPRRGQADLN